MKKGIFHPMLLILLFSALAKAEIEFPQIDAVHPYSGQEYDSVMLGEIKRVDRRNPKKSHLKRLVTFYNIHEREIQVDGVPSVKEDCHDSSNRFFSWAISKSKSRTIESSFSFEALGLEISFGGDVAKEISIGFERWIQATAGMRAIHTPMLGFSEWEGVTFEVKYYPHDERVDWSDEAKSDFFIDLVNPVVYVQRDILEVCEG